jgi:hypothetical protein
MSTLLIKALRDARKRTVDLGGGKEITFLRPPEGDFDAMLTRVDDKLYWDLKLEHIVKYSVGWSGFSEVDILGAGVGGDDVVPFEAALWTELLADNVIWQEQVKVAIRQAMNDYQTKKDADAKNSAPA